MKAPAFEYFDPTTREEVLELLAEYGDEAKVLAGGQSLVPLLNFRLAHPRVLVDLNRVTELGTMEGERLGAMVRQRALEGCAWPLICQAMPLVGHAQIRNRGTLGGSLAHADPAAELPAVMVALEARFVVQKRDGRRSVPAEEFFLGQLTTALAPDELLVEVQVPAWPERTGSSLQEVAMRRGDFALGGVATRLSLDPEGRIEDARIVPFGVGERPVRQREAEASLVGRAPCDEAFDEAARIVSEEVQPWDDIHASAAYRKRLAGLLTRRALAASVSA